MAETKVKVKAEAKPKAKAVTGKYRGLIGGAVIALVLLFAVYGVYWFKIAETTKAFYVSELSKLGNNAEISEPVVSGFPGKVVIRKDIERISSDQGTLEILSLKAKSWPFPNAAIDIATGEIKLRSSRWLEGLSFDSFNARMRATPSRVVFENSALKQRDFEAQVTGSVDISDADVAIPDLVVTLSNHQDFLAVLVDSGIIEQQAAAFVGFGLSAFAKEDTGHIEVPIYARNGTINLGPLPIMRLPEDKGAQATDTPPKRVKPDVAPVE